MYKGFTWKGMATALIVLLGWAQLQAADPPSASKAGGRAASPPVASPTPAPPQGQPALAPQNQPTPAPGANLQQGTMDPRTQPGGAPAAPSLATPDHGPSDAGRSAEGHLRNAPQGSTQGQIGAQGQVGTQGQIGAQGQVGTQGQIGVQGQVGVHGQVDAQRHPAGPRQFADRSGEHWRFRHHGGQWWYWTPAQSWMIWSGDTWTPYSESAVPYQAGYGSYSAADLATAPPAPGSVPPPVPGSPAPLAPGGGACAQGCGCGSAAFAYTSCCGRSPRYVASRCGRYGYHDGGWGYSRHHGRRGGCCY